MKSETRSLKLEIARVLIKRTTSLLFLSGLILIAAQLIWSLNQRENISGRTTDAVAALVADSIRSRDLVSLKRILAAFQIANMDTKICVRLNDGVELADTECSLNEYRTYEVPLSNETFSVGANFSLLSGTPKLALGLILLCAVFMFGIRRSIHTLAAEITGDLSRLSEGQTTADLSFVELQDAKCRILEAAKLRQENVEVQLRAKAQHELSNLATQVAHDIRSPLSALNAVLIDRSAMPETHSSLIKSSIARINSIAETLLERGRQQNELSTPRTGSELFCDLGSIMNEVCAEKREAALHTSDSLDFENRLQESISLSVTTGRSLQTVISNMLNNSIEATVPGRRRIVLSAFQLDGNLTIEVRDNGSGISAELLPLLGGRGFSNGKPRGNGLGLHSAKMFAKGLRGDLSIRSVVGEGSTIAIRVPVPVTTPMS